MKVFIRLLCLNDFPTKICFSGGGGFGYEVESSLSEESHKQVEMLPLYRYSSRQRCFQLHLSLDSAQLRSARSHRRPILGSVCVGRNVLRVGLAFTSHSSGGHLSPVVSPIDGGAPCARSMAHVAVTEPTAIPINRISDGQPHRTYLVLNPTYLVRHLVALVAAERVRTGQSLATSPPVHLSPWLCARSILFPAGKQHPADMSLPPVSLALASYPPIYRDCSK